MKLTCTHCNTILIHALFQMHCRCVGVRDEALAAASFVHAGATDRNTFFRFKSALRIVCGLVALHADGVGLGNVFRNRQ